MKPKDEGRENIIVRFASKFSSMPNDLHLSIMEKLLDDVGTGNYLREKLNVELFYQRLPNSRVYLKLLRYVNILPIIDLIFMAILIFFIGYQSLSSSSLKLILPIFVIFFLTSFYIYLSVRSKKVSRLTALNSFIRESSYLLRVSLSFVFIFGFLPNFIIDLITLIIYSPDQINSLFPTFIYLLSFLIISAIPSTFDYLKITGKLLHPLLWIFAPIIDLFIFPRYIFFKTKSSLKDIGRKCKQFFYQFNYLINRRTEIKINFKYNKDKMSSFLDKIIIVVVVFVIFAILAFLSLYEEVFNVEFSIAKIFEHLTFSNLIIFSFIIVFIWLVLNLGRTRFLK